jgi:flagellar motor switch protein FliM
MTNRQNLSKEEIEALSGALNGSDAAGASRAERVREYDFVHPEKLSKANLRALHMVFSGLERPWSKTISAALRSEASVRVNSVQQSTFGAFGESHGLFFAVDMHPLPERAFIGLPASFASGIVERMAGGHGEPSSTTRPLTLIESDIAKSLIGRLMPDFKAAWNPVAEIEARLMGAYASPNEIGIIDGEPVLVASMTWNTGIAEGEVGVALPIISLESVIDSLDPQRWVRVETAGQISPEPMMCLLKSVDIPVSIELGTARVSVRDVLNMEMGDIVVLHTSVDDPLEVRVGDHVRFRGRPGRVGKRLSVQITNTCAEDARANGTIRSTGSNYQSGAA